MIVSLVLEDSFTSCVFTVRDEWPHDESGALFYYIDGNFGCDCNRADLIRAQCDPEFPDLGCGDRLTLKSLLIDGVAQNIE